MVSKALVAGVFIALLSVWTAPASATTFCVPSFSASCPDNGSNVAQANLETAMGSNGSDGIPDQVLFGPATYTDSGTLEPVGIDPLEVVGSGTEGSDITSSDSSNTFVVNLNSSARVTTMRDLSIIIPSSFPDGLGGGLQARDGTFVRVNIESRNPGSDGAPSLIGNTIFRDSRIFASSGGTIDTGLKTNAVGSPGSLSVVDTVIENSATGVDSREGLIPVSIVGSRITKPLAYDIFAHGGSEVTVVNSILESGGQAALLVTTDNVLGETDAAVAVRNSTFVATGDITKAPVSIAISPSFGSRSASVSVADSIFRGFDDSWDLNAPAGPGIGTASLTFTDSNFPPDGLPADSPQVDFSDPGNINADPLFTGPGDYRLLPGSPSIDAAGNSPGGPAVDYTGAARPRDGDGDGIAVSDQGAFESPDTFAPKITKLRAKSLRKGKIRISFQMSEPARVIYSFRPAPRKLRGKKRKAPVLKHNGRLGANALALSGRRLSPGRYRVRITAIDSSGNRAVVVLKAKS